MHASMCVPRVRGKESSPMETERVHLAYLETRKEKKNNIFKNRKSKSK
jgi:hypothetical protein